ncbi:MAG: type I-C CRISPR-associated protein Cas5c [Eubacteriales bacterium]
MENKITFRVTGRYGLFTDPVTKIGGEKNTLMIPTYEALKGICSSIYWKPSIIWYIDRVCIVKPIKTESKGIRPIKYGGGNDLAYYTYLSDVEYIVTAHFEFNRNRMDLQRDFNENKHYFIAKRSLERGGRRDIFLGTRECQGYVELCEFTNENSCYKQTSTMEFGLQFHSFIYPDEGNQKELIVKLWNPRMVNGVIEFIRPTDCPKERVIRKMGVKKFEPDTIKLVEQEVLEKGYEMWGEDD